MNQRRSFRIIFQVMLLALLVFSSSLAAATDATPVVDQVETSTPITDSTPGEVIVPEHDESQNEIEAPALNSRMSLSAAAQEDVPEVRLAGQIGDVYVRVGENVPGTITPGRVATLKLYMGQNCSGSPYDQVDVSEGLFSVIMGGVGSDSSIQAEWADTPGSVGNCVNFWISVDPVIMVSGSTTELRVVSGRSVDIVTTVGTNWSMYDSMDCSGQPMLISAESVARQVSSPPFKSFQAALQQAPSTTSNCVVVTWEDLPTTIQMTSVCGDNNDIAQLPDPMLGLEIEDTGWTSNRRQVKLTTVGDFGGIPHPQQDINLVDTGNCLTDAPVPPVQTQMCGPENDEISVPAQPAQVLVSDSGWAENVRTITFSTAVNYDLPSGAKADYVFTDSGPCWVIPIMPDVPTEVCGPNNDILVIPEQPEGVSANDTGWVNNQRTVSFMANDALGYDIPSDTGHEKTFTDANISCEENVTPVPTGVPTAEPTMAVVSALPETGAGSGNMSMLSIVGGLLLSVVVIRAGLRRIHLNSTGSR